jgi:di/tricarboxylate transporter
MAWISRSMLGSPKNLAVAQGKLMFVTSALSTVINNTPVVALFVPVAQEWASRLGFSVSKLLMPMNHIVIIAGMCTLVGTSTNLIVNSLLIKTVPDSGLGLFDLAWVGLPLVVIGFLYVFLIGHRLLPDRQGPVEQLENAREYSVEARVLPGGPLVGRSIAEVGLRSMKYAFVLELLRGRRLITAVSPDEVLEANDRVTFVGVVDAVNELRRIPGLSIAEDQTFQLNLKHAQRCLVELVLSESSPLIGQTVKESGFRSLYHAAIISISRDGNRIESKLGEVKLRPGDTLLVETGLRFVERHRYNRDFLLVSRLRDSTPPDFRRAPLAFAILLAMLLASAFEIIPLFQASFIAGGLMIATGCVTLKIARRSIEYPVLVSIAASFALGFALAESGAANCWPTGLPPSPWGSLLGPRRALCGIRCHDRTDHQQCGRRADVPHRDGGGGIQRRQLPAVRDHRHGGCFGGLHHADRLPDEPHDLWARWLQLDGLRTVRRAAQYPRRHRHRHNRAARVAFLNDRAAGHAATFWLVVVRDANWPLKREHFEC